MKPNDLTPLIRDPQRTRIHPNRIRVWKDPASSHTWVVYMGSLWLGSAHSRTVAYTAVHTACRTVATHHEAHYPLNRSQLIALVASDVRREYGDSAWRRGHPIADHKHEAQIPTMTHLLAA